MFDFQVEIYANGTHGSAICTVQFERCDTIVITIISSTSQPISDGLVLPFNTEPRRLVLSRLLQSSNHPVPIVSYRHRIIHRSNASSMFGLVTSFNFLYKCNSIFKAFTRVVVSSGWVGLSSTMQTPERIDFPDNYVYLNQPSTFVIHQANVRFPAQLKIVEFYSVS